MPDAGVTTMDDIGPWIADGNSFKLAASEEFVSRPDVLPAFEDAYGFQLNQEDLLVFSGGNTATTMQAAARNQDGVNAAMAYGTDGQLAALGLQVLDDTKGVQPVYRPAPVVREEVYDQYKCWCTKVMNSKSTSIEAAGRPGRPGGLGAACAPPARAGEQGSHRGARGVH